MGRKDCRGRVECHMVSSSPKGGEQGGCRGPPHGAQLLAGPGPWHGRHCWSHCHQVDGTWEGQVPSGAAGGHCINGAWGSPCDTGPWTGEDLLRREKI